MNSRLEKILTQVGVFEYGIIDPCDAEFTEDVRQYCIVNTCGKYDSTWACPPAIGTVEDCRKRARSYEKMLLFSGKFAVEDSFDYEGYMRGMEDFKGIVNALDDELRRSGAGGYLLLGNEGCGNCESCTYPGSPCRFPEKVHGSIEGYGLYVYKLAEAAGIRYNNGEGTVTYFGALLFNDQSVMKGEW